MKRLISLTAMVIAVTLAANSFAQEAMTFKIGALRKRLANPYFLSIKEGYDYAQKKFGIELVFGSTPTEEADVDQLNILQNWFTEGASTALWKPPSDRHRSILFWRRSAARIFP